nr:uncharacterized protein LOC109184147 [Ipomoea batatas]
MIGRAFGPCVPALRLPKMLNLFRACAVRRPSPHWNSPAKRTNSDKNFGSLDYCRPPCVFFADKLLDRATIANEGEEPNEGRQGVGDEFNEESDDEVSIDDTAEVNEESHDEGNEGDEDNYDSAGDDTEFSEFENDFGGVTQEDNIGQGLEGEDLETAQGKRSEIKAKVKTTKAKASERNEVEGEACSDDYYYESEDPPSQESKEEEGHQKKVCPAKRSVPGIGGSASGVDFASTSMPSTASAVDASSNMPSAASA